MAKKKRSARTRARVKSKPRTKPKKKSTRKRVGARRKPAKKKPVKRRRKAAKKRTVTKKRKPAAGRKLVKQVTRSSVERVMAGRRRRKSTRTRKRPVRMAGRRRQSVGAFGGSGLIIGLGIGALAIWALTKKPTPTGGTYTLPPIAASNNYTRNTQANDLVQYAIAGGLAIDAIIKLIDRLNSSSDQEVHNIYDRVNTTGDFSTYV